MKRHNWMAVSAVLTSLALAGCADESPEKRVAAAKQYLQKNDTKAAVIEIKNALQANPDLGEARYLLGTTLLRNPLALLAVGAAGGVAAGFLLFKYQKEIVDGLSKVTGMGKDFALHQKENLNDLMATAEEKLEGLPTPPAPAAEQPPAA